MRILVLVLSVVLTLQITITTATLETGTYKIKGQNRLIGRMCNETRDLFPKKICSVKDSSEQVVWLVKALNSPPGSDTYSLENGGAPIVAQENLAYATLYIDQNVPDTTWSISAASVEGQYTISVFEEDSFLTEPRKCGDQVTLEPASGDRAQIWTFLPAKDDNSSQCFPKGIIHGL